MYLEFWVKKPLEICPANIWSMTSQTNSIKLKLDYRNIICQTAISQMALYLSVLTCSITLLWVIILKLFFPLLNISTFNLLQIPITLSVCTRNGYGYGSIENKWHTWTIQNYKFTQSYPSWHVRFSRPTKIF